MRSLVLAARGLWWRRWSSIAILVVATACAGVAASTVAYAFNAGESVFQATVRHAPVDSSGTGVTAKLTLDGSLARKDYQADLDSAFRPLAQAGFLTPPILAESDVRLIFQAEPRDISASIVYRSGSCSHLTIVSGRCVRDTDPDGAIITRETAANRGWRVGTTVDFGTRAHLTTLRVVGIYEPILTQPGYWLEDQYDYFGHIGRADTTETPQIDAVLVPSAFWDQTSETSTDDSPIATTDFALVPSRLDRTSVARVGNMLTDAYGRLVSALAAIGQSPSIDTNLPTVLAQAKTAADSVEIPILGIGAQLAILTWLVLFLLLSSSAQARAGEVVLGKLRGLTPRETFLHAILEPLLLIVVAVLAGGGACVLAVRVFGSSLLGSDIALDVPGWAWVAAVGAGLGGVIAAVLTSVTMLRRSVIDQWRHTERRANRRGWLVDAVVATLALAGFVEVLETPASSGFGAEILPSAAPGLLAIACALAGTRLIPLVAGAGLATSRRSRHVAAFIALRQLARRSADQRVFVLLTVSVTLVVFAVGSRSVFARNQHDRARTELGAERVVDVRARPGVDPSDVVAKLDPSGRQASAVYVGGVSNFGGTDAASTGTTPTLLVVDPRSFSNVAFWRADFGSARDLADQLKPLQPMPPALVAVTGTSLRMTATVRLTALLPVSLHAGLTDRTGALRDVALATIDPTPIAKPQRKGQPAPKPVAPTRVVRVSVRLPACAGGCQFRRFSLVPNATDQTYPVASIVVTALDEVFADGRVRSLLPALRATTWTSPDNASGGAGAVTVATDQQHLSISFAPQYFPVNSDAGYETDSNVPSAVPAIVSAGLLPPSTPPKLAVQPAAGLPLTIRPNRVEVLPRSGDAGVVIARTWLPVARPDGYDTFQPNQVWLSSRAPGDFVARLSGAGLSVRDVRTASDRARRLAALGPVHTTDMLWFGAVAAAILAVAGFTTSLLVTSRRRLYELAALRALGMRPSRVLGSLLLEQIVVTVAAGALGVAAGLVSAQSVLRREPEYTDRPRFPPLTLGLPTLLCVLVGSAVVVAIIVSAAAGSVRLVRRASPSRLRDVQQ